MFDFLRRFTSNLNTSAAEGDDILATPEENAVADDASAVTHTYQADHPIGSRDEDLFDRWPFAHRLAETLATRVDSSGVVVGIYGPWGDGKTSVLALMESAFKEHNDVVVVRFNPWYFSTQEALLRGFFQTLAEALGARLATRREQVGDLLKRYGGILSVASLTVGGVVQLSPGEGLSKLGEGLSTAELTQLRERIEAILKETGTRIVVMIDDIDRLDRDEIHAIFKLVKLSAGFEHTSYVLAFDDEVVADSLSARYGAGSKDAGRAFLEKIVQVPLRLPAADDNELRTLTFSGVDAAVSQSGIVLSRSDAETFGNRFVEGLEPRLQTPRQAKLYINAITFALPLLKGEVHPVDQMLIEGVRVFYPKLYDVIRNNPKRFLTQARDGIRANGEREAIDELIQTALAPFSDRQRRMVLERFLPSLFPRFGTTGYGSDWESRWAREKRICSEEYFSRYFAYTVPRTDISDQEVEEFIRQASSDNARATAMLQDICKKRAVTKLIKKLRDHEDTIDPNAAPHLAELILSNGELYPREEQIMLPDWTFMQAAIFSAAMLRRQSAGAGRVEEAKRLMSVAKPLGLGANFLRWLRKGERESEDDRLLPESGEVEVGRVLAQRIKERAEHGPLHHIEARDTPFLLWIWNKYGNSLDVRSYLASSMVSVEEVLNFLGVFLGRSWAIESGVSSRSDFDRSNYDSIIEYVDPAMLFDRLKERYGDDLDNPNYHLSEEDDPDRALAHQYAVVHLAALAAPKDGEVDAAGDAVTA